MNSLNSQGYQKVYDVPYYFNSTTFEELNAIKSKCSFESMLCAGGAAKGSNNLQLISCGNCVSILTPTPENTAVLNNGAY